MTPAQVAHIMALPAKYQTAKRAVAKAFQTENFDARIESLTNLDVEVEAYARAAVQAAQPEAVGFEEIEAMATSRYKVVPSHESMFHRFAVVAGDGTQQLYLGREVECQNMAAKFTGAFLDGAFAALKLASAPTEPMSAPTAEPVAYWFQKHNCFGQLVWDIAFSAPRDATQVVPLYATPPSAATPEPSDAERDDPLQGAVDWFLQADGEFFCVATVQRTLRIGYNRAKRLCDVAKERATKGGKL